MACQRRSGSPFGEGAYYAREKLAITGEAREYVRSTEVGVKSEWFGHRLRFNADVFDSHLTDMQTNFLIADSISDDIHIASFGVALVASLIMSVVGTVAEALLRHL